MIIRHDTDPVKYLAEETSIPSLGSFKPYGDHAILIHPFWLLTAAHVAKYLSTDDVFSFLDGCKFSIDRIVLHPGNREEPEFRDDLALIGLRGERTDIDPIKLYTGDEELNQVATFFGRGETGDGVTGPNKEDTKLRIAQNRIIEATIQR